MKSIISRLAPALAVTLWALPVFAQADVGRGVYEHHDFGVGMMLFGGVMMIAFWGGIILLIVLVVRWLGSGSPGRDARATGRQSAVDILQERYARGEIDHDEFERRKQLLAE